MFKKYDAELRSPMGKLAKELAKSHYDLIFGLIEKRINSGMTQTDVAKVLGISQQAVAKFESMDSDPRLSTISDYAMAINVLVTHEMCDFKPSTARISQKARKTKSLA